MDISSLSFIFALIVFTIIVMRYEIKRSPTGLLIDEYYKKINESIILESIGDFKGQHIAKARADEIYKKIQEGNSNISRN